MTIFFKNNITILKNNEIDFNKWDNTIKNSINESPLAYSDILNIISPSWEGLIIGDYEEVMPLPVINRLGIKMIQMPPDVQNLGLFSSSKDLLDMNEDIFSNGALVKYKFIAYSFNAENNLPENKNFRIRTTFYLNLNKTYRDIYKLYNKYHKRNLRVSEKHNINLTESTDPEPLLRIRIENGRKISALKINAKHKIELQRLMTYTLTHNKGKLIYAKDKEEILAGGFFLQGVKKNMILMTSSTVKGKKQRATFAIVDYFIRNTCEKDTHLDFCGSDIKGIADFNKGFGAVKNKYIQYNKNQLPFLLRKLKEFHLYNKIKKNLF